jgi:zinc D-Ala-D-Ala dipeptidase
MTNTRDAQMRRAYWTQEVELAVLFMEGVKAWPVAECGEGLVHLPGVVKDAGVEVQFSSKPHVQGLPRLFYLREGQIKGFIGAAREFNQMGWVMKVEDGYRSRQMQKFVGRQPVVFDAVLKTCMWELEGKVPTPEFMFHRCKSMIAYCPKVGTHMSGSAIDISLFDRKTGAEVSRGKPYLEISELTPMYSPYVEGEAMKVRMKQVEVMRGNGFVEYPFEFWHFNSGDVYDYLLTGKQGEAARYGAVDFDVATGKISPMTEAEACAPLNSFEEMAVEIAGAIARVKARA